MAKHDDVEDAAPSRKIDQSTLVFMTSQIAAAYLRHNIARQTEVPELIQSIHQALLVAAKFASAPKVQLPAVPIKKSVTNDYLICLEDGKKLRMLKRYLMTHHKLTPEQYRQKWELPHDYPMVAPSYAVLRSTFAKQIGLGQTERARPRRA